MEEPPNEPDQGDPTPDKDKPIGDPPPKRDPKRLSDSCARPRPVQTVPDAAAASLGQPGAGGDVKE